MTRKERDKQTWRIVGAIAGCWLFLGFLKLNGVFG